MGRSTPAHDEARRKLAAGELMIVYPATWIANDSLITFGVLMDLHLIERKETRRGAYLDEWFEVIGDIEFVLLNGFEHFGVFRRGDRTPIIERELA